MTKKYTDTVELHSFHGVLMSLQLTKQQNKHNKKKKAMWKSVCWQLTWIVRKDYTAFENIKVCIIFFNVLFNLFSCFFVTSAQIHAEENGMQRQFRLPLDKQHDSLFFLSSAPRKSGCLKY